MNKMWELDSNNESCIGTQTKAFESSSSSCHTWSQAVSHLIRENLKTSVFYLLKSSFHNLQRLNVTIRLCSTRQRNSYKDPHKKASSELSVMFSGCWFISDMPAPLDIQIVSWSLLHHQLFFFFNLYDYIYVITVEELLWPTLLYNTTSVLWGLLVLIYLFIYS